MPRKFKKEMERQSFFVGFIDTKCNVYYDLEPPSECPLKKSCLCSLQTVFIFVTLFEGYKGFAMLFSNWAGGSRKEGG